MSHFLSGNYNSFDDLIHKDLPEVQTFFEQTILSVIDKTLLSMLGRGCEIEKSEINANVICESGKVESVDFELTYTVADFQVPDAPADAIAKDTEAIEETLKIDRCEVKEVEIDVKTGVLHIVLSIPFGADASNTDVISGDQSDSQFGIEE